MKRIAALALFVAASFITAGTALAEDHLVKVTVPFNFTVGNSSLPSGTYMLRSKPSSPEVVSISNREKRVQILTVGQPDQVNQRQANKLVFHKYGDQYFLSDIRTADSSINLHFAATKAEKRARTQTQVAGVPLDEPVMIALNQ